MTLTDELKKAQIAGLLEEQRQVKQRHAGAEGEEADKLEHRLALIEEQLAHYGHKAKAPAKRAEKRPARKPETR